MTATEIDVEKGEGGLKAFEAGHGIASEIPASPHSSQGTTICGRQSTSSDGKICQIEPTETKGSSFISSGLTYLGIHRKSQSQGSDDEEDSDVDDDEDESVVRKIHDQPRGYPRMATFSDSDESFMIYRRFGYLSSRLLLDRQEELRLLEMELDIMEKKEQRTDPEILRERRGSDKKKQVLLDRIETKWNAYCQLLSNASTMTALNKPTGDEQKSVVYWMKRVDPLKGAESKFVYCKEDLVTLRPGREHAWLDSTVEKLLKWFGWAPIRRAFQSKDTRSKSDGKDGTVLYTRSRIEHFVVGIITLMIMVLLVVPIWLLYRLTEQDLPKTSFECIGVLLVSTLAFSACISLFTRAQRHEILAASAAYCAVLVVFIGNIGHV